MSSDRIPLSNSPLAPPECGPARPDSLVASGPATGAAFHLRGVEAARRAEWRSAAEWFARAIAAAPEKAKWGNDLGAACAAMGDWKSAARHFRGVSEKLPDDPVAAGGYGRALFELGESAEAIGYLERALRTRESLAVRLTLANALSAQQRLNEAAEILERAAEIEPARVEPALALAALYFACGELDLARRYWETALNISPDNHAAQRGLIETLWGLGDIDQTLTLLDRMAREGTTTPELYALGLNLRLHSWRETAASLRSKSEAFGRYLNPDEARPPQSIPRLPVSGRPLRIGYLGGDLIAGPPFQFLSPLLGGHDREKFQIFLYHTRDQCDDAGTRWYAGLGNWKNCFGWSDTELQEQIDRDAIDILVNISGFFPRHSLSLFSRRAAPVQVVYPNCPSTTGVAAIDYILTDRFTCPPGHEFQYTEQPVFIPSGYLAYAPAEGSLDITGLPAERNGYITFGLFQRRAKINTTVYDAAAAVLRATPGSRLLVQNQDRTLDDPESGNRRQWLHEFRSRGIDESRLLLAGWRPPREVLAWNAQADIALDSFPYGGQTTTCACLWHGVPVIALAGEAHVSRVSSGILERLGLHHCVAETAEEYVRRAAELAADLPALARLRAGLRGRMARSTVVDGRNLAREVESIYTRLWAAWCQGRNRVDLEQIDDQTA